MTTARTRPATEARKREILSAALNCFDATGVEPATIQDIQRQAGCSVGSLYHHFGSKEGVAEALWLALIEEFNVYMLARLGKAESAEDAVRAFVDARLDNLALGPLLVALIVLAAYPETAHVELEELNPEDALAAPAVGLGPLG